MLYLRVSNLWVKRGGRNGGERGLHAGRAEALFRVRLVPSRPGGGRRDGHLGPRRHGRDAHRRRQVRVLPAPRRQARHVHPRRHAIEGAHARPGAAPAVTRHPRRAHRLRPGREGTRRGVRARPVRRTAHPLRRARTPARARLRRLQPPHPHRPARRRRGALRGCTGDRTSGPATCASANSSTPCPRAPWSWR